MAKKESHVTNVGIKTLAPLEALRASVLDVLK